MLEAQTQMASSPGQTLNGQEVRRIPRFQLDKITKIATWNVRTLFAAGRLDNLIQEMDRMKIEILGVCEVRWPGSGMVKSGGKVFYYSGDNANRNQHGVGILMNKNLQKSMKCFVPISERVALVQILGKPLNINIIQVYAPTADKPEQEVEDFYKQIDTALKLTRTNEINIILGDFNAKVGRGRTGSVVGDWGLGERNNRGEGLVQYCEENNLMIANTWFKLPARRLYTWKSPQDNNYHVVRNQIDYIIINRRFRNYITKISTMPGADIASDHNSVCANIVLRLAKPKRKSLRKTFDLQKLKVEKTRLSYEDHLNKELENVVNTNDTDR
ncbi:craniofacial development protein 2-like [Cylas formicarius]|uniref:craniofacial development protein 2-like n=1 Tax=Cylas formicarius TaxID=197179 RepID=UPI0029588D66|nr:craniofacial development protein 2-like [Cylas formicarius]